MKKTFAGQLVTGRRAEHGLVACTWCDVKVPLPDGDMVGVCIECGAVVFRSREAGVRAHDRAQRELCDMPFTA